MNSRFPLLYMNRDVLARTKQGWRAESEAGVPFDKAQARLSASLGMTEGTTCRQFRGEEISLSRIQPLFPSNFWNRLICKKFMTEGRLG